VGASCSNGPRCPFVSLSVCHMRISPKLSEIDLWLIENANRNLGFPIQNLPTNSRSEVRLRHFGVLWLALHPFRQKWTGWSSDCGYWISGNSHQSAPHWAPWRASYRHVPSWTIPCLIICLFWMFIVSDWLAAWNAWDTDYCDRWSRRLSVCLSRGWTVQKRLNGLKNYSVWRLLWIHGTPC